jgi:hypothetical protein
MGGCPWYRENPLFLVGDFPCFSRKKNRRLDGKMNNMVGIDGKMDNMIGMDGKIDKMDNMIEKLVIIKKTDDTTQIMTKTVTGNLTGKTIEVKSMSMTGMGEKIGNLTGMGEKIGNLTGMGEKIGNMAENMTNNS